MDTAATKPDGSEFRGDILFELFGTFLSTLNSATRCTSKLQLQNYLGAVWCCMSFIAVPDPSDFGEEISTELNCDSVDLDTPFRKWI